MQTAEVVHFQQSNAFPFYCARCDLLFASPEALLNCLRAHEEMDRWIEQNRLLGESVGAPLPRTTTGARFRRQESPSRAPRRGRWAGIPQPGEGLYRRQKGGDFR